MPRTATVIIAPIVRAASTSARENPRGIPDVPEVSFMLWPIVLDFI
jgi:hypothetical protein